MTTNAKNPTGFSSGSVKKNQDICGMSTPYGITFVGDKYTMGVNNKGASTLYKKKYIIKPESKLEVMERIPFIRGIYKLVSLFSSVIRTKKRLVITILLGYLILYAIFSIPIDPQQKVIDITLYFNFMVFLGLIAFFWSVRTNHGLEHKLISAYGKGEILNVKNVQNQPSDNRRCGGVLAVYGLLFLFLLDTFFGIDSIIVFLLVTASIGYECQNIARKETFIGDMFYFPGWFVQQFTTRKKIPEEKIKTYLKPFKDFVELEEKK